MASQSLGAELIRSTEVLSTGSLRKATLPCSDYSAPDLRSILKVSSDLLKEA